MPPLVADTRAPGARHDNSLPQWAVDKIARRRGRQHAFPTIEPHRTALVVIDLTQSFLENTPCAPSIVQPVNLLADALRHAGGTVAWVDPAPIEGTGSILNALWGPERVSGLAAETKPGSPQNQPAAGLTRHAADVVVDKQGYSAFFPGSCALPEILQDRNIDTVLIAGVLTNICCESSARDASGLGFRVVMVADANAARSDEEHQSALYNVLRNFGDVRLTGDLIDVLCASRATA